MHDGLAVEREADVQLEAVGAVRLGAVEALEGVLERLRRRAAVADDARDAPLERSSWRLDYPRGPCRDPHEGRPEAAGRFAAAARPPVDGARVVPLQGPFAVPISTIDWLVSRESPAARYVVLRDLLGRPAKDPELKRARQALSRDPFVRDVLALLRARLEPGATSAALERRRTTAGSGSPSS